MSKQKETNSVSKTGKNSIFFQLKKLARGSLIKAFPKFILSLLYVQTKRNKQCLKKNWPGVLLIKSFPKQKF
jgi:hypothetical protein